MTLTLDQLDQISLDSLFKSMTLPVIGYRHR